ncbi:MULTISPECIES: hypothetical protein [unclassified Erwinia]|uniref:hypothetical protein n=1 Tax=unclassified Erwinia TaxID=2622719 RepID=UPI000C174CD3|nr:MULTISPECIES: hypothetical protein [unclassified Erwinia]PIJ49182.1 hypothetical protein BV501_13730 [Erwinia sp. OAMSP11]PIJ79911.1 hypothetical protein BLD47_12620 [Erwinia sp. OLCASP19]PIJ81079.1 hypothetical protein BLD46_13430 [Erwinia sp. OLMTSP26]PIJ93135.1 hypothetical protein BL249_05275 [Erwinia sp. OLFS4]
MTPIQFIEKNVISELVKQGFDNTVARMSADRAVDHYRRSASASAKGKMFDDCLFIAKAWAKKYQSKR